MKNRLTIIGILSLLLFSCTGSRYAAGDRFYAAGQYDDAIRAYTALTEANPDDYDAFMKLGEAYKASDNPDGARQAYAEALRIKPGDPVAVTGWQNATLEIAENLRQDNRHTKAINLLESLREKYPEYTATLAPLADSYAQTSRLDKAKALYEELLETEPENTAALEGMKRINASGAKADKVYNEAVKLYKRGMHYEAAGILEPIVENG